MVVLGTIFSILIAAGVIVLGYGYLQSQWFRGTNQRQTELDGLDEKLIARLQETQVFMEKRLKELEAQHLVHKTEIERLTQENAVITKIFQGRDEDTKKFQQEGFRAIQISDKIYELLLDQNKTIVHLCELMEKHIALEAQAVMLRRGMGGSNGNGGK